MYKLYFRELVPLSQSDFVLDYAQKDENLQQYTVSFNYNKLDIEWIPYYADEGDACSWCSDWCAEHTCLDCDHCAHSHCFNCYLKGKAFWWMLARMSGWNG